MTEGLRRTTQIPPLGRPTLIPPLRRPTLIPPPETNDRNSPPETYGKNSPPLLLLIPRKTIYHLLKILSWISNDFFLITNVWIVRQKRQNVLQWIVLNSCKWLRFRLRLLQKKLSLKAASLTLYKPSLCEPNKCYPKSTCLCFYTHVYAVFLCITGCASCPDILLFLQDLVREQT